MAEYKVKKASEAVTNAIEKELQDRKALYQERDQVMHNMRKMRLMRHKVQVPKAYRRRFQGDRAVKLPIIYRMIQTAVSTVTKSFPSVYVEPFSGRDKGAADDYAKGMGLLLQSIDTRTRRPYIYALHYNGLGDGLAVTKTMPGGWARYPLPTENEGDKEYNLRVRKYLDENPLPFISRVVDPLTFYPPLNEYGEGAALEMGYRQTREVLTSLSLVPQSDGHLAPYSSAQGNHPYSELELPLGLGVNTMVEEVWTDSECAIKIGGDVFLFENTMGESPYEWGYADPTGVEDPTNVGMSVAFPLYYLQSWVDTMVAIGLSWGLMASPTIYTTQDPVPGVRPTMEHKIETFQPGMMYHFPTGRKPGVLAPPAVGDNLTQMMNFLIEASDRGGLPALVSGAGVGTRLPALTFQAAFEAATDRLIPAIQSQERILAKTLMKASKIIGMGDIPVKVNGWDYGHSDAKEKRAWHEIKPSEARKGRQITVSLAVDSTQDLIAKGTHAQYMMSAMLWDMEKAMRFSGVKNVTETKSKIAADTAWRQALPYLAQAILAGDEDVAAMIQQQASMQAQAGAIHEDPMQEDVPPPEEEAPMGDEEAAMLAEELLSGGGGGMMGGGEVMPMSRGGIVNSGMPPGPGRNRKGTPAGRGGGKRGGPTQKPRGRRQGYPNSTYGRT